MHELRSNDDSNCGVNLERRGSPQSSRRAQTMEFFVRARGRGDVTLPTAWVEH
jgi:hypothetical protein